MSEERIKVSLNREMENLFEMLVIDMSEDSKEMFVYVFGGVCEGCREVSSCKRCPEGYEQKYIFHREACMNQGKGRESDHDSAGGIVRCHRTTYLIWLEKRSRLLISFVTKT